jgi:hypothetical protein
MQVDGLEPKDDFLRKPKVKPIDKPLEKVKENPKPEIYQITMSDRWDEVKRVFLNKVPELMTLAISGSWIRLIILAIILVFLILMGLKIL